METKHCGCLLFRVAERDGSCRRRSVDTPQLCTSLRTMVRQPNGSGSVDESTARRLGRVPEARLPLHEAVNNKKWVLLQVARASRGVSSDWYSAWRQTAIGNVDEIVPGCHWPNSQFHPALISGPCSFALVALMPIVPP